jgi:N-acetyl-gamma-glutamyl-phosphate reductase
MIRVSIIGITGYAGIELYRLLKRHPEVEIVSLISHTNAGEKLSDIYPQFSGNTQVKLEEYDLDKIASGSDLVFTALPHGVSQKIVAELYDVGLRIIDLSGDYRYKDAEVYEKWYKIKHNYTDYLNKAVYGLVEINREKIREARFISNPGCYPTASILGLWPLVEEGLINTKSIIIDAKSGLSGAGRGVRQLSQFIEVDESVMAYAIATHRHTSEIEYVLSKYSGKEKDIIVSFTPHLLPVKRGILSSIYTNLNKNISQDKLNELYREYYPDDGFVHLVDQAASKYVVGSNYCHLEVKLDSRTARVVVISVIDNLIKGAAGQAIQNMNVSYNLDEKMGLKDIALFP